MRKDEQLSKVVCTTIIQTGELANIYKAGFIFSRERLQFNQLRPIIANSWSVRL